MGYQPYPPPYGPPPPVYGPGPYPPPGAYPPPGVYPPPYGFVAAPFNPIAAEAEKAANLGLILGIIGIIFSVAGIVLGPLALYFGMKARRLDPSRGLAGICLGGFTILCWVGFLFLIFGGSMGLCY